MSVEVGKIYKGKVSGITKFGAFVKLESGDSGMVHISEIADSYVSDVRDFLSDGQDVTVKVLNVDDRGRLNFSIKKAVSKYSKESVSDSSVSKSPKGSASFEDMLNRFKQESEEKFSGNKNFKDSRKSGHDRRWQK